MESFSREFALFIDGIRLERGMSRLDLIEDIVSLSQYKRYLRGVTAIPNDIVLELASRLRYNITDLYSLYTRKHSKEDTSIREIYNLIKELKYDEASKLLEDINPDTFVSEYYISFYDYIMIHLQHMKGQVSDIHVLSMYSQLINFPDCMNNESFNLVETNVLYQIVKISSNLENYHPADLLYETIINEKFNFSAYSDVSVLPGLYYAVARVFYMRNILDKTVELSQLGVKVAIENHLSNALPQLYTLTGFAHQKLGDIEAAHQAMRNCFLQLILSNNKGAIEPYKKTYEQYFELPLEDLLKDIHELL